MPKLIGRMPAIRAGMKFFYTGKPCRNGHVAQRFASSGLCTACEKDYRSSEPYKSYHRDYMKRYRKRSAAFKGHIS